MHSILRKFAVRTLPALLGVLAVVSSASAQVQGVVLRQDGSIIASTTTTVATGEVAVPHGETSTTITAKFIGPDAQEFTPVSTDTTMTLNIVNTGIATVNQTGPYTFEVTGVLEGITDLQVTLNNLGSPFFNAPNIEVHVEEEHAEADGLVLRNSQGDLLAYTWMGQAFGELSVGPGEMSDSIFVTFLDPDSMEFAGEDEPDFFLQYTIGNGTLASVDSLGRYVFKLNGLVEGITDLTICLWHIDHCDFTAPAVEVHVEEEHAEADGLVLRNSQGDLLAYTWMGQAYGGLTVTPTGMTDSIFVTFLDPDSMEFAGEDESEFFLQMTIGNGTLASMDSLGRYVFRVNGLMAGETDLTVCLWHVDHCDFTAPAVRLHVGNLVSVAPLTPGLLEFSPPAPNPMRREGTLSFVLPTQSQLDVEVFDALGRRVESLYTGVMSAGAHSIRWRPGALGAGVYFVRLKTPESAVMRKVVLSP